MATVATMTIGTLATTCAAHYCGKFQKQQMAFKDLRLRLTNEILNGIKVIKLNAWEPPFIEKVKKVRTKELSSLRKYSLLQSAFGFIWAITPFAALLASFGTFLLVNRSNQLSPSLAFTCLSLFMLLRLPVYILPEVVSRFIKCKVSLKRLSEFLDEEDLKEDMVGGIPEEGAAVTLSHATFSWSKEVPPVLKDVNLNVKAGSLVAVVGSVGSGKSSLLSAVLGALEKVSGSVDVQGRIAYVAQQSWIQNATLKENIIFTNSVDEDRYRKVVEACALIPDLDMLPGGDNTQVGDKGFNLSGGQKLRISLARAVFHDADVYLLDDPFSAVDIHVASHLFDHVVGPSGILKSKTRILMTHSVTFLSQADWIVYLENGRVQEQGTYNDLLAGNKSGFCAFLRDHVKRAVSDKAMNSTEESSDVSCNGEVKKNGVPKGCRVADDEKVNSGNVGWHIYREYPKRVGWKFLLPSILTTYVAYGCKYGSSLWLSLWSTDPDPAHKHEYILGYGMILVVMCIFNLVHWVIFLFGSLRAAASFHDQLLQSVMRSPISFFDTTPMGRVINRFSRDIDLVDKDVPFYAAMNMANIASMSLLVVVLCIPSAYFVFIVVVTSVLFLGLMVVSLPSFRQVRRLQSVSRSPVLSHFGETISGALSIRAFGATEHFVKTLEYLQDNSINCHMHAASLDGCRMVLVQLLTSLLSLGAALVTVLVRHSLDPGMVGMVLSYTLQMADEVSLVGLMSVMLTASLVAVERVMEYFNLPQEAPWRNAKVQPAAGWPTLGEVAFSDYSAAYRNGDKPVLRHINFKSRGGQKVGVVGRTGAGKSTCALALFRVVEPKTGSIVVDDVDVTEIGLHDLRLKMTIIPQDPVLFAGTLRWNLDPFNEHPDEALWKALEQAHLKDFVASQESGLDCDIAEGGENLSAGQRQLVCLARALLRNSKVLVLDEATSSVDLETERLVKETTRAEFQSTTVITIAHKLHTVMDCDQILVLSAGEIVEQGSPADLLKIKDGLFFKIARDAGLT
uniref:Putative abc transporter c family member n=1 Tax=Ixodes ricinus TaxID=34613 RepID=A0A6B0VFE5_IXORI